MLTWAEISDRIQHEYRCCRCGHTWRQADAKPNPPWCPDCGTPCHLAILCDGYCRNIECKASKARKMHQKEARK